MLSSEITNVLMGNTEAQALYLGDELLWKREIDTCPQIQYPLPSNYSTLHKPTLAFYVEVPAGDTLSITIASKDVKYGDTYGENGYSYCNFNGFGSEGCKINSSSGEWITYTHTYTTAYYGWISFGVQYTEMLYIASREIIEKENIVNGVGYEDCKIWQYTKAFYDNAIEYGCNYDITPLGKVLTKVVTLYNTGGVYIPQLHSIDVIFYRTMSNDVSKIYLKDFNKLCTCDFVKYLMEYSPRNEDYPEKGTIYVSQEIYNLFTTKDLQTIASKNYNITIKT